MDICLLQKSKQNVLPNSAYLVFTAEVALTRFCDVVASLKPSELQKGDGPLNSSRHRVLGIRAASLYVFLTQAKFIWEERLLTEKVKIVLWVWLWGVFLIDD